MSAIGCHAQHLACFVTGQPVARVAADVGALMPGRTVVDHVSALLEFGNGARGTFTVTQAAAGGENDIRLRVYGDKGLLDWCHRDASYLTLALQGEPAQRIGRGDAFLPPEIIAAGRTPRGHPEGLREAFANIYADVAQERIARELGRAGARPALPARRRWRAHDGFHRGLPRVARARRLGRCGRRARLSRRDERRRAPPHQGRPDRPAGAATAAPASAGCRCRRAPRRRGRRAASMPPAASSPARPRARSGACRAARPARGRCR